MKLLTTHLHRTAAIVGAAALAAAGLLGVGAPSQADEEKGVWDRVAECESGGNWSINTGNGYYGGLQFSLSTWKAFGGEGMPHEASREEQIRIAQKTLAVQGPGAWPTCGKKAGLTKENGAADDGRAEEPKKDEPKAEEPKAEEPKAEEPKTDEPTEEPKNDEPTEEPKADEDSTNDEPKQDEPAEEPKSDEPADDPKDEEPAEGPKDDDATAEEPTPNDDALTETPDSDDAGTDEEPAADEDENQSNGNDTGLTGHVIDHNK